MNENVHVTVSKISCDREIWKSKNSGEMLSYRSCKTATKSLPKSLPCFTYRRNSSKPF